MLLPVACVNLPFLADVALDAYWTKAFSAVHSEHRDSLSPWYPFKGGNQAIVTPPSRSSSMTLGGRGTVPGVGEGSQEGYMRSM